jgi:TonB family protein
VNFHTQLIRRLLNLLALGCLSTQIVFGHLDSQAKQPPLAKVPESVFRKLISKFVMPAYPEGALKRAEQGVAVASVQVNEQGNLTDVQILEAPSDDIGNAVLSAIRQCKFNPANGEGGPLRIEGKLTFYFAIENGRGIVRNPRKSKS